MNSVFEIKFSVTKRKNLYTFEIFIQSLNSQAMLNVTWIYEFLSIIALPLSEHALEKNSFHATNFIEHYFIIMKGQNLEYSFP